VQADRPVGKQCEEGRRRNAQRDQVECHCRQEVGIGAIDAGLMLPAGANGNVTTFDPDRDVSRLVACLAVCPQGMRLAQSLHQRGY
jgi:hypothetical protein